MMDLKNAQCTNINNNQICFKKDKKNMYLKDKNFLITDKYFSLKKSLPWLKPNLVNLTSPFLS